MTPPELLRWHRIPIHLQPPVRGPRLSLQALQLRVVPRIPPVRPRKSGAHQFLAPGILTKLTLCPPAAKRDQKQSC